MASPAQSATGEDDDARRQQDAANREAYDYWGYLFKADKTGTDRFRELLTSVKHKIVRTYEASDNPDITPIQLAHFYREMHGNYDQLFLNTPHESIAFIYKSLGCLHSLQPQALTHSTAFSDPTVPALKTDGWVMWQTIQVLLGPDEHASFLSEAVQRWDLTDPKTGQTYPKLLPRACFPAEPDKHMVAWYEGVSERLRHEAEEELRQGQAEADKAEVRRIRHRPNDEDRHTDDEGSIDSRGPALAYFRNPLYRHVDGRPTIVRNNSKRPALSPRPTTVMDKGKEAATTFGHVVRNIGSPRLWDGKGSRSASHDRDRERRRRSIPEQQHLPSAADYDATSPQFEGPSGPGPRHHRSRSSQRDRLDAVPPRDDRDGDGASPMYSPQTSAQPRHSRHNSHDTPLRRPRSHEPTPSQKEYGDYFEGYDRMDSNRRRNSTHASTASPSANGGGGGSGSNGGGHGFGPSASPLFATHIARQPQPATSRRPPAPDRYNAQGRKLGPERRPRVLSYSRSPDVHDRDRSSDRRDSRRAYESPRRPAYDGPGADFEDDLDPPRVRPGSGRGNRRYDSPTRSEHRRGPSPRARHHRRDGSDVSFSGPDERERMPSRPKQTRFAPTPQAVAGVDGRRYPNEAPWR